MMRALFSAISGMKNHMSYMDVVGNNIANVNTTAYKSSRVTFQDILGQTIRGASSAQNGRGGTNPAQIGLGMNLAGIDNMMTQGSIQSTGKLTDFAIQGDGFFVVSDGSANSYTRDGAFDIGVDGGLINPTNGLRVMGWKADALGNVDTQTPLTPLEIPFGTQVSAQATTKMKFSGNLDASAAVGDTVNTTVTAYDSLGVAHSVKVTLTKMAPNTWAVRNSASSVSMTPAATGDLAASGASVTGAPNTMRPGSWAITLTAGTLSAVFTPATYGGAPPAWGTGTPEPAITGSIAPGGTNTTLIPGVTITAGATIASGTAAIKIDNGASSQAPITFSDTGQWSSTNSLPTASIDVTSTGAASPQNVTLDLSGLSQFAGESQVNLTNQDGFPAGALTSFAVGSSGEVSGIYSNGSNRVIGQLALANFVNAGGLQRMGQNLWAPSASSGDPIIGAPNTNGRGAVSTGSLEGSNVDLAQEFTDVIVAQRGFQASSRVITASDQLLQDLVGIIR
jgi:flagellar hook protein FlgE